MPFFCFLLVIILMLEWFLTLKEEFQAMLKVKGQEPSLPVESLKGATIRLRLTNYNFQLLMFPAHRTELSRAMTTLGRGMPGLQNPFTLIILYKVSSGNILAHLHLKSIKTLSEICFCFSNFPFFVYLSISSIFAIEQPPRQFRCFITQRIVEAREFQHQPTPTGRLRCCLTSSPPR